MDSMIFKIYFPNIYEILIIRAFPLFLSCAVFENIFKKFHLGALQTGLLVYNEDNSGWKTISDFNAAVMICERYSKPRRVNRMTIHQRNHGGDSHDDSQTGKAHKGKRS